MLITVKMYVICDDNKKSYRSHLGNDTIDNVQSLSKAFISYCASSVSHKMRATPMLQCRIEIR